MAALTGKPNWVKLMSKEKKDENNLIIVTRNISDFGFSSVNVFRPWD